MFKPSPVNGAEKSKVTNVQFGNSIIEANVNKADVSNWTEFKNALEDPSIENIFVSENLQATSVATVNGNKTIEFNHKSINILSRYITINAPNKVTISNISIGGSTSNTYVFNGTGELIFKNDVSSSEKNQANIANMSGGNLIFDGVTMTFDNHSNYNVAVAAKNFTITNASTITSTAEKFYGITNAQDDGAKILIDKGSKVVTTSLKSATGNGRGQVWDIRRRADFYMDGEGTMLSVTGDGKQRADNGGIFLVQADHSTINVLNGATLDVHSLHTSAILLQSQGGIFNVDNDSEVNAVQDGDNNYTLGSTIRFRIRGGMTFNVTNKSKINIEKKSGNAPAIRMYGGGNAINISGASDFMVHNVGDGVNRDGGGDNRNQGILYTTGAGNSFKAVDEDSNISIISESGIPFDSKGTDLNIDIGQGSYFVARGKTSSINAGIFNSGKLTFMMDTVKYFDFRNGNKGNIFSSANTSTFVSKQSDLSVWEKNRGFNQSASKSWNNVDFELNGTNLANLQSSTSPTMIQNFDKMTNYSRMSANNQRAIVDDIRVPTDADQSVFAHVSVPGGKYDPPQSSNDGENSAQIGIYAPDGKSLYKLSGTTNTLSIYGEPEEPGWVKVTLPDDKFLAENQKVKVLSAWRGTVDDPPELITPSLPEDIKTDEEKVYAVVPPKPVVLETKDIDSLSKEIFGNGTPDTTAYLYLNDNDTGIKTEVSRDGKFRLPLPDKLVKGDKVQILLQDKKGLAKNVINPPYTNSKIGNIEPIKEFSYHDTKFLPGTSLYVIGQLTLAETPQTFDFGTQKISTSRQTFWPEIKGNLIVTDTRDNSEGWQIKLSEETPFIPEDKDKSNLNSILYYQDEKQEKPLSKDAIIIYEQDVSADGKYVITDGWGKENNKGIKAEVPVENQLLGSYTSVLNWSMEMVPNNS
ncbi:WxL domain-containing protein [Vagococcus penaei]|nr:WxL domain-containing protein [Vagococcus penaei]